MSTKKHLLLGTRKGLAVYYHSSAGWQFRKMHFTGIPVSIAYVDEQKGIWWVALDHGHWGVKLHRSFDRGSHWEELTPPKYADGIEVKEGVPATVQYIWALAQGSNTMETLWVGTIPGGLFKSTDGGGHFELVESLWNHPSRPDHWFGGGFDHPGIHSIVLDPRDAQHLFIGVSCAGVFESRDGGATWLVRNQGLRADYLPDPQASVGHDPHLLLASPAHPDWLWQQNHCGIFRSTDGGQSWQDVSEPEGMANFGFTIALDEKNGDQAWVVPAISDHVRVAKGAALCVCRTDDGGQNWQELRAGLPQTACYDIVYRHALDISGTTLAFGTTCGNLFLSEDKGDQWTCLNSFLPMIYSVTFAP
ncbi:MAG: glycosyl hydrolase [Bacteroidota bacterium]